MSARKTPIITSDSSTTTSGICKHCGHKGRGHVKEPSGYVPWFEWAEKKGKTHEQQRCPDCGRFTIWVKKSVAGEAG